jgi:hypothetical protein
MAKKPKTYKQNLIDEIKETWNDIKEPCKTALKLIKDLYNMGVQMIALISQLVPIFRTIWIKIKKIKFK